jgi:hypothetical protein
LVHYDLHVQLASFMEDIYASHAALRGAIVAFETAKLDASDMGRISGAAERLVWAADLPPLY